MFQQAIYNGIKAILKKEKCFYDQGQIKGKSELKVCPAVLILPKSTPGKIVYFGKIASDRDFNVVVTIVDNAPYSDHDNSVQDKQLDAFKKRCASAVSLLTDVEVKDNAGRLISSGLEWNGYTGPNFVDGKIYMEFAFRCEAYDYTLCPEMVSVDASITIAGSAEVPN